MRKENTSSNKTELLAIVHIIQIIGLAFSLISLISSQANSEQNKTTKNAFLNNINQHMAKENLQNNTNSKQKEVKVNLDSIIREVIKKKKLNKNAIK
ncbi:hypothetical protein [Flavobacterium sp. J27]|uniref:hypothetical protein n=1 Tax=Flavobacterium sp. J27 TaxID=2060419 RepID=UPI0010317D61|nr:hypothetical protein [Flavobacterium sp. J27]